MKTYDIYYTVTGNQTYVETMDGISKSSVATICEEKLSIIYGRKIKILRVVEL